jgi:hypothetical protein
MIKCRGKTHFHISKRTFVERGGRIDTPTHKYMITSSGKEIF